jgi:hypothetical protein
VGVIAPRVPYWKTRDFDLRGTVEVHVTPKQFSELGQLCAKFENGQISEREFVDGCKAIEPNLQEGKHNALVVFKPLGCWA